MDKDLVAKDEYGNYYVKNKTALWGYIWVGKSLVPRFAILGLIFVGALFAEIAILIPHITTNSSVEGSFWLLTLVTIVSATIFLIEGIRFRKKHTH